MSRRKPTPPRRANLPPKPPLPGPPLSSLLDLWSHRSGDGDRVVPTPSTAAPEHDPRLPVEVDENREPAPTSPTAEAPPQPDAAIAVDEIAAKPPPSPEARLVLCSVCREFSTFKANGICTRCEQPGVAPEDKAPQQDGGER